MAPLRRAVDTVAVAMEKRSAHSCVSVSHDVDDVDWGAYNNTSILHHNHRSTVAAAATAIVPVLCCRCVNEFIFARAQQYHAHCHTCAVDRTALETSPVFCSFFLPSFFSLLSSTRGRVPFRLPHPPSPESRFPGDREVKYVRCCF